MMEKNHILVTRRSYEVKGGLFDQQILKKGRGQVPVKEVMNDCGISENTEDIIRQQELILCL